MIHKSSNYSMVCRELPTSFANDNRRVLVTGAKGYIGGRLIPELIARGYRVRVMVRNKEENYNEIWPEAEVVAADAADPERLGKALEGVDVAYYFIHSLTLGQRNFEDADIRFANNFRTACARNGVKRIIYLGGLGNRTHGHLSPHLESRIRVGEQLAAGPVPVTILRAGMIIGSGSASFIILKNLVEKAPVFFIPSWAKTRSQPVSIRAVILYLVGVMENERTTGKSFDIGGPDVLTYDEKLKVLAHILGKNRFFFRGFFGWTALYGYIASLLTPIPRSVTRVLVESCKNEVVCENNDIQMFVPIHLYPFRITLRNALAGDDSERIFTDHDAGRGLVELNNKPA